MSSSPGRLSSWLRSGDAAGGDGTAGDPAAGGVAVPAAAAASSSRLEPSDSNLNTSNPPVGFAAMVPCKCRCRTCEKCGGKLGWRVRQCMLEKAERFRSPAMLSLTVDRKHFASPEEAHTVITEGSYIARLMRLLGVATWFWVLEFQTKSGDGWPHWHLLIDLADAGGQLDLPRAWRLWRDKWGLGGLDLSTRRSFADRRHAVNYITKYLTKMPEAFPLWVILRQKGIRFVGGCKSLGSLTGQPSRPSKPLEPDPQLKLFREPRTPLVVRMARCEMTTSIFCVDGDCETGQGGWSWMAGVKAAHDDLETLAAQGLVSLRIASVEWGETELWAITNTSVGGVVAALRELPGELEDREVGYSQSWAVAMKSREAEIVQRYTEFWTRRAVA